MRLLGSLKDSPTINITVLNSGNETKGDWLNKRCKASSLYLVWSARTVYDWSIFPATTLTANWQLINPFVFPPWPWHLIMQQFPVFSVHFHALLTDFLSLLFREFKIEIRNCGQFFTELVNVLKTKAVEAVRTCSLPCLWRRKAFKTGSRSLPFALFPSSSATSTSKRQLFRFSGQSY